SVWAAEAYGSDAPSMLAWIAGQTRRIDLGAGIMQIPGRSPALTAMTAATIDMLSGGRFRLGLGVSGPQVSEGWHGVRLDAPLAGRDLAGFDIVPTVPAVLGDDVARCGDQVRSYAALYLGGMGSREKNFYNALATRMGYGAAAREIQDLYLAKRHREAAAAVPL